MLCLQETKCRDAEFPIERIFARSVMGISRSTARRAITASPSSRNIRFGVIEKRDFCAKGMRGISPWSSTAGGAPSKLHNFYVPAGGDEPDATINPKFAHKLDFLDEMTEWIKAERVADGRVVLVGDLNIAPLEHDVWSHKALLKIVSHTPMEVEKLEQCFRGRRVDRRHAPFRAGKRKALHMVELSRRGLGGEPIRGAGSTIFSSASALGGALKELDMLREARGWERPSDHVPVSIELAL